MTSAQIPLAADSGDAAAAANAAWLTDHLGACIAGYMDQEGVNAAGWRGQPLSSEEVSYFRRGVEEGLLVVSDAAVIHIDGFHSPKRYRLFQSYDGGSARPGRVWSWSWRESFTQLAFACELVLDHAWPHGHVALEVGAHDLGAGKEPVTHPILLAEAKVKALGQAGLEGMLAVFAELSGGPPAEVGAGVRQNATRKYQDLLRWRPAVFVAVAPGVREVFDVACRDDRAVLWPRYSGVTPEGIRSAPD